MSLNFGQISSLTTDLATSEHLKTTLSPGFLCIFSSSFYYLQITRTGIISKVFELISGHCFQFSAISYLPVFNLEGAMGPLIPFWIKWHRVKAELGYLYHYVNEHILDSVLFLSEIE